MTDIIQLTDWQRSKKDLRFAFETLHKYKVKHEIRPEGKYWAVFVEHDPTVMKDYKNFKGKRPGLKRGQAKGAKHAKSTN